MLRRRVESDIVQDGGEVWESNLEGLNRAIQILVIDSVLVVITPRELGHFVPNESNAIIPWVGFNLLHHRACPFPSLNSRLHSHCGGDR